MPVDAQMPEEDDIRHDVDGMVQETMPMLLVAVGVFTWLWTSYTILFDPAHTAAGYLVLLVVLAGTWITRSLYHNHLDVAFLLYLASLLAGVSIVAAVARSGMILFFYVQVILVAVVLGRPLTIWVVTFATVCLMASVNALFIWDASSLTLAILYVLLAAATGHLSSRHLVSALSVALSMYGESRRNAEEARNHRAELQRVLKALDLAYVKLERANQALIFAQESAEKAYRFKSDFVANVSHELRTPLNLIIGFSEMMVNAPESYGGVLLPPEYRGDTNALYRSARHLRDLINDVLDLSQIESGRLSVVKAKVDLRQVVDEAVEMVRGLAEARRLELAVALPQDAIMLQLDRTRTRQVMLNLLTNAIRFTDQGYVQIRGWVEGLSAVVAVQDSGRGIEAADLSHAFEAFSQFDEQRMQGGSGLGLAVSKKFVELHGGRMWIESERGKGTTVSFELPLPERGAQSASPAVATGGSLSSSRTPALQGAGGGVPPLYGAGGGSSPLPYRRDRPLVLVLHEDARVLTLLQRHIPDTDFVVATTPDQARTVLAEQYPDAVLVDDGGASEGSASDSGPNVAGAWHRLPLPVHLPVIHCSLPLHGSGHLLSNVAAYLPKPVEREQLAGVLKRLPSPPHTVLIVDDNPHIVRLLARMLHADNPGLRVLEAYGGRQGMEIIQAQGPDLVLLDLAMPEMSGRQFLEELARSDAAGKTQLVVVSVHEIEEESAPITGEVRMAREAGMSLSEVLSVLQSLLATVTRPDAVSPASAAARL